ncbi:MAG: hypothetical protein JWN40_1696 [Phycisphaerales bacterium]|nr:hypothetical protein [Phycisphaerales bacterium]
MLLSVESAIFSKSQGVTAGFVGPTNALRGRQFQNRPNKREVNPVFILFTVPVRVLHPFQIFLGGHDR